MSASRHMHALSVAISSPTRWAPAHLHGLVAAEASWCVHWCRRTAPGTAEHRAVQASALEVPEAPCGIAEYHDLVAARVTVNWRGRLSAPAGVVGDDRCVALPNRRARRAPKGESVATAVVEAPAERRHVFQPSNGSQNTSE